MVQVDSIETIFKSNKNTFLLHSKKFLLCTFILQLSNLLYHTLLKPTCLILDCNRSWFSLLSYRKLLTAYSVLPIWTPDRPTSPRVAAQPQWWSEGWFLSHPILLGSLSWHQLPWGFDIWLGTEAAAGTE